MNQKVKYTTAALTDNQYLVRSGTMPNMFEVPCIGYTDKKRDTNLDGFYMRHELKTIKIK